MNPNIMEYSDQKVTAKDFMANIYLSVAWDEMHGCVEAAPSDCPHQTILQRIFSASISHEILYESLGSDEKLSSFVDSALSSDPSLSPGNDEARNADELQHLCRLALRVHTAAKKLPLEAPYNKWRHRCHQPLVDGIGATIPPEKLVLPNMQVPLPEGEASQWIAQSALQVREIEVMSTIGVTLGEDSLKSNVGNLAQSPSSPSHSIEEPAESAIWESLSPLVNHGHPEFYCAIFQSSFNEDCHNPSNTKQFYRLHRYSHLATTSLVRQLFAFGVHVPVIGVLLSGSRIAFHVDWATAIDGRVDVYSALYTPDEVEEDFRQWDLCQPADALEVVLILNNLRRYAFGGFKSAVTAGLSNFWSRIYPGDFRPWRWDGKMMVDRGEAYVDDYDESQSISSAATEESELKVETSEVMVVVHDTQAEGDQIAPVELLTAALTLHQKAGDGRRAIKRILPSPPQTPAEDSGVQPPAPESQ